jgi:hypothetical protein
VEQQEMPRPIDTRPGHAFQRLTAPPVFDPVVNPTTARPLDRRWLQGRQHSGRDSSHTCLA